MNEYTNGLIRHVLTGIGGVLIAKGQASAETIETIIGGVMAILGVAWSMTHKKALINNSPTPPTSS